MPANYGTYSDKFYSVPLRTNIRHDYCYKFKSTGRNTSSSTGIDFTRRSLLMTKGLLGARQPLITKSMSSL